MAGASSEARPHMTPMDPKLSPASAATSPGPAAATGAPVDAAPAIAATDIAVIGRSLRVPGARTVDAFWDNLRNGVESVRRLSDAELRAAGVDPALLADPNYIKV